MGDVVDFPGKEQMERDGGKVVPVEKPQPIQEFWKKFIINGEEFYADSVTRPVLKMVEWNVHTLQGTTMVGGPSYWSRLLVLGPEELGNEIQGSFPLGRMDLEFINPETEIVEEWWEFYDVYLSTETTNNELVILFKNATKRN